MRAALLACVLTLQPTQALPPSSPHWQFAVAQPTVAEPAATMTGIDPSENPEVVRVICLTGMGSAFWVGPHILLSVAHVTNLGLCAIDGNLIKVIETKGDFAVIYSDRPAARWFRVDCGGFKLRHKYTAIGYARGLPVQTSVDVTATGDVLSGFAKLWGVFTVIPGQSGGPMIDPDTRRPVGMVNVFDALAGLSGSVPLRDTPICHGGVA
jgi:hypothetical protein